MNRKAKGRRCKQTNRATLNNAKQAQRVVETIKQPDYKDKYKVESSVTNTNHKNERSSYDQK